MNGISTHILDTSRGAPAAGVNVVLEFMDASGWKEIGRGTTNADGRVAALCDDVTPGEYRIRFATAAYFQTQGIEPFYPEVIVQVRLKTAKYHLPLLLNPFGYSTYRGS